jgi:DNA-binding NtrC family response regulator
MNGQRSVLIVDRSEETREVLQTVLERRGVRILTADRTATAVALAGQHHPDLIVLDMETCDPAPAAWAHLDETPAPPYEPQLILLGSVRGWRNSPREGEFMAKPYHYGPLVRRIEELLSTQEPGPCRHCSLSEEPIKAAASS